MYTVEGYLDGVDRFKNNTKLLDLPSPNRSGQSRRLIKDSDMITNGI